MVGITFPLLKTVGKNFYQRGWEDMINIQDFEEVVFCNIGPEIAGIKKMKSRKTLQKTHNSHK